jgi:hypothetical protein
MAVRRRLFSFNTNPNEGIAVNNPNQGGQQGGNEHKLGQQTQKPGQGGQQGDQQPGQQNQK